MLGGYDRSSQAMTGFVALGIVGLLIVIASLILGEFLDGLFEAIDLDTGSGLFSAPVIGSFLGAFGFGGALIMYSTSAGAGVGALGGLGSGILVGGAALGITRFLIDMPTDESMRTIDLVGQRATVITPIPADGMGEVTLVFRGQMLKLGARADEPVPSGRSVVVTAVMSPSAVLVRPAAD